MRRGTAAELHDRCWSLMPEGSAPPVSAPRTEPEPSVTEPSRPQGPAAPALKRLPAWLQNIPRKTHRQFEHMSIYDE